MPLVRPNLYLPQVISGGEVADGSFSKTRGARLSMRYKPSTVCLFVLVVLLPALFPINANSAFIRDYTKGRFTFTGSLGLKYKEHHRKTSSKADFFKTTSLRRSLETGIKGFAWDPRFMVFKAGFTVRQEDFESDGGGGSRPTSYQYSLFTTWLPKRRNPFLLHAHHIITEVQSDNAPTYEVVTDTFGMRWGLHRRLLGHLSFAYDARMAKSSGGSGSKRDQMDQAFKIAGQRKFKKRRSKIGSDVNYGYTYDLKKNRESGRETSEHRINVNDRTIISPTSELSAEATYYFKEGQGGDSDYSIHQLRASSRLSNKVSDQLGTNYGLSFGTAKSYNSNSQSASGSAGVNYLISDRWQSNASISLSASSSSASNTEDRINSSANGGVSYRQQWGIYNLSSNYGLSLSASSAGSGGGAAVGHNFGFGLSQSSSILWSDSFSYSFGQFGSRDRVSTSHGLTYGAKSQVSLRDRLYLSTSYSYHVEDDSTNEVSVNRESNIGRAELGWTHKFSYTSSLNSNITYSDSDRKSSDSGSSDNQTSSGSISFRTSHLFGLRNLLFNTRLRHRQSQGKQRVNSTKTTVDANFDYKIGRWIASLKLERYVGETGSDVYENRSFTFNIKRVFGFRF